MLKRNWFFAFGLLLLIGCEAPRLTPFSVNIYQNENPIALSVGDVQVKSEVKKFDRLPHIEEKMPLTPEDALYRWAKNRFYGINMSSPIDAVITIQKAYMTQTDEQSDNWYMFDNVKYRLTYTLTLQFKEGEKVLYTQNVDGWESSSLPQRSSLADKEETWQKMMNAMIRKVNDKVINGLPTRFRAND